MYCQNCGRESHCGKPKNEMLEANYIEVCKYCRCDDCALPLNDESYPGQSEET
jgi:hypothetical protein